MHELINIVIVGGGAAGIEIATKLGRKLGKKGKARITLIDCAASHIWKPLLHEVATGALDIGIDAINYREHGALNGYHFQQGSLFDIDRVAKQVILAAIENDKGQQLLPQRQVAYDYMVIAIGSVANDFQVPGVQQHCLFLDNTKQAMEVQQVLLSQFMRIASNNQLENKIKISIVGGGATGVEMAAEMQNALSQLRGYGYTIDSNLLEITLIELHDRILPQLEKRAISEAITKQLLEMGIIVKTGIRVAEVSAEGVHTLEGEMITADIVIWSTGVKAPDFLNQIGGLECNKINQIMVSPNMQSTCDPRIFAIGDCAACPQADGSFVPPRGQSARQMALMTADNLCLIVADKPPVHKYVYKDLGSLVNLSKSKTVGNLMSFMGGGIFVEGRIARFTYNSLYRRHLIEIHGVFKGSLLLLVKGLSRIIHSRLKLH